MRVLEIPTPRWSTYDAKALVGFLSRDKPLAGWQEKLLSIEEITGEGDVELKDKALVVRRLLVRGQSLEIQARGRVDPEGAFGKARAKLGIFTAGIGLRGQERNLKLLGVGNWYKRNDIPGMPAWAPE